MPVSLRHFKTGSEYPVPEEGKLRFYSMQFCPYAQRTKIILLMKNIDHETVNINLSKKPEWYLEKINPLGKVPCIHLDDKIVYDSAIINDYVDSVFPGEKLNPTDSYQLAQDRMLVERFGKVIAPFYAVFLSNGSNKEGIQNTLNELDEIEKELEKKRTPFFGGENPMMVDIMLWPHAIRCKLFGDFIPEMKMEDSRFPRLNAWFKEMYTIPAIKATEFTAETLKTFVQSCFDKNPCYDLGLD